MKREAVRRVATAVLPTVIVVGWLIGIGAPALLAIEMFLFVGVCWGCACQVAWLCRHYLHRAPALGDSWVPADPIGVDGPEVPGFGPAFDLVPAGEMSLDEELRRLLKGET